jgi:hypothetical protein
MTIIGVCGNIGSGKSFTQLKQGLIYAEQRQKRVVANFPINKEALRAYCKIPKYADLPIGLGWLVYELRNFIYALHWNVWKAGIGKKPPHPHPPRMPWILSIIDKKDGIMHKDPFNLAEFLEPESVCLLDEAGIFLNSRDFAKTPKELLYNLAQSRKEGADLIWAAQFDEQVDRQMRLLTQFWIHCKSMSLFDIKLRRPKLVYKQIYWLSSEDYNILLRNPRDMSNPFKLRWAYAAKSDNGWLTLSDRLLFEVFNSFRRLDQE